MCVYESVLKSTLSVCSSIHHMYVPRTKIFSFMTVIIFALRSYCLYNIV